MNALQWALAQPEGSRARALADAILSGTRVVTIDGKRVEYASLADLTAALSLLHSAEGPQDARRGPRASIVRVLE